VIGVAAAALAGLTSRDDVTGWSVSVIVSAISEVDVMYIVVLNVEDEEVLAYCRVSVMYTGDSVTVKGASEAALLRERELAFQPTEAGNTEDAMDVRPVFAVISEFEATVMVNDEVRVEVNVSCIVVVVPVLTIAGVVPALTGLTLAAETALFVA